MAIEADEVQILAGVRHGLSLGSPIALTIDNKDWANWREQMSIEPPAEPPRPVTKIRPGHADLAGALKYGHQDLRDVIERASARETAARVALGAIARQFLRSFGILIRSHTLQIGAVKVEPPPPDLQADTPFWADVEESPVRCGDSEAARKMMKAIDQAREKGDSLGGVFEVIAFGVPAGLGSYSQWGRRLNALLAEALMSIPSAKAVEVGGGFSLAEKFGSEVHDVVSFGKSGWSHQSNRAGGIEGGISNGEPIVLRVGLKPIPTLGKPLPSVDLTTKQTVEAGQERSDVCVVPAAGVVGEAMVALVLTGAFLEKFGGDSLSETKRNFEGYLPGFRGE